MSETTIVGYGALFNVETVIQGLFRERIAPGAFRDTIQRDDIRSLFNHNPDTVLGRMAAQTVTVLEDTRGLRYEVRLNADDPVSRSVAAKIQRRDVSGSSFWFAIDDPADEEWQAGGRGHLPLRTLRKLRLIDVGPVAFPAYVPTTVAVRTMTVTSLAVRERVRMRLRIAQAWR